MISFATDRTIRTLVFLLEKKHSYVTEIMQNCETTFAHASRIVVNLESEELVECVLEGRIKRVFLTMKGKDVARHLKRAVEGVAE